jgi:hypothetical protein
LGDECRLAWLLAVPTLEPDKLQYVCHSGVLQQAARRVVRFLSLTIANPNAEDAEPVFGRA